MESTALIERLRSVPLFEKVERPDLERLAANALVREYPAGHTLFFRGDPGYTLFAVLSGRIAIQTVSRSGNIVRLGSHGPGQHFGEMALLDGSPRMADAVVAEPARLLQVDRTAFCALVERSPRFALAVMAQLAGRLRASASEFEVQRELTVLGRIARFLLDHARTPEKGAAYVEPRPTHQELANEVAATRESVSRAFGELRNMGAIKVETARIRLTDREKLERLAAG